MNTPTNVHAIPSGIKDYENQAGPGEHRKSENN